MNSVRSQRINRVVDYNPLSAVILLDVESIEDLARRLKKIGYSDRAIAEILKWYLPSDRELD